MRNRTNPPIPHSPTSSDPAGREAPEYPPRTLTHRTSNTPKRQAARSALAPCQNPSSEVSRTISYYPKPKDHKQTRIFFPSCYSYFVICNLSQERISLSFKKSTSEPISCLSSLSISPIFCHTGAAFTDVLNPSLLTNSRVMGCTC